MSPHRLRRAALHLPARRSRRSASLILSQALTECIDAGDGLAENERVDVVRLPRRGEHPFSGKPRLEIRSSIIPFGFMIWFHAMHLRREHRSREFNPDYEIGDDATKSACSATIEFEGRWRDTKSNFRDV
jgi:hypothetical protein